MSDDNNRGAAPEAEVAALQKEHETFAGIVKALRDAIRAHTTARMVATNEPLSPGLLMSALLSEAANVCTVWGVTQNLRPSDIEDIFDQGLRNARRVLRGNLHEAQHGTPTKPF